MVYKGISTTAITDGGTQAPTIGSSIATNTLQAGNVVLYGNQEFVWNGSKWELLGDEGSYKVKQTAVTDPSADGYEVSFIDSLSQDANGKITATKKTVVSASTTTNGLMTADMVTKLNGIATGANKYTLPVATSSNLGGIKSGGDISITSAGIVTVPQISTTGLGTDSSTHDLNTLYVAGKFKFWNLSSNGTYNNAPGGTVTGTRIGLYCYPISSSAFVQEAFVNGKKYFRISTNSSVNDPVVWADWQLLPATTNLNTTWDGKLNLTGGTMTGNLFIQGTNPYLGFKNSSGVAKGYVQYIQNTDTYALGAGAENSLKVSATGSISIPANQTFTPATNNTGTIGTTDKKWNNIYATTFTGNLSGTATKATQDGDGNTISSTYLKLSGGTMTGDLALLTGDTDRFIVWDYSTSDTAKGASWRIGELGSGSGNTNYFVIQTTGSSTGSTETYANAMRIGMNNKDVAFFGDVSTSGDISTSEDVSAKIITASEKFVGALEGNASSATILETTRTINGMSFNGSANVTNYGVCGTDAAVVAKTVTVGSTFVLAEGAQVVVKFTNTNSASNPTLSVNGTTACQIKQYGDTAIGSGSTTSAWAAGSVQTFTYDGEYWVRDYWSNTTYTTRPITQTVATDNVEYPLLSRTTSAVTTSNGHAKFAAGVTLNPSTKTITATAFKGNLTGNVTGNLTGNVTGNVSGSSGSCTGNAATATKLQTAQTIKLTGDVTGSASFTGNTECSISTTITDDSHNHNNFMTDSQTVPNACDFNTVIKSGVYRWNDISTYTNAPPSSWGQMLVLHGSGDTIAQVAFDYSGPNVYLRQGNPAECGGTGSWRDWKRIWCEGNAVTGAVWNDYAECRESDCEEAGYVLAENGDDTLSKTQERLAPFAGVSSDTWGFSQGETERARTPIAVAGRVLVYTYQDRNNYKPGDCVCAAPNGTVDIMTREEVINWPDRIVGTVSCVPEYEEWGGGKNADRDPVKVNGRIWIKIR